MRAYWRSSVDRVLDGEGLQRIGGREAEEAGIEGEFGLQAALNALRPDETVPLSLEGDICGRHPPCAQGLEHHLGLVGRDHTILQPLKEDHRAGEALHIVN